MNVQVLIDQIVRQTTVLLAQLATSGGARAPLSHVADRVFLELAKELDNQGVSRKVGADMFGVALRSYRRRVQRLTESTTQEGRSLWEALLDFIPQDRVVTRGEILAHFVRDEPAQVASLLKDMCESGLLFRVGRGDRAAYRAVTTSELASLEKSADGLEQFLWILIYREGALSQEQLLTMLPKEAPRLPEALQQLLAQGLVEQRSGKFFAREVVVAADADAGWEAAMFDHFQALIRTLSMRLRGEGDSKCNGGSTYSFDMNPAHPLAEDVYGTLERLRSELSNLRQRVERYNQDHPELATPQLVTVYAGQFVQEQSVEPPSE